jgi:hypothetical protein
VIHWPYYNPSLVRRGEILFSYDFLDILDEELEKMNKNKYFQIINNKNDYNYIE